MATGNLVGFWEGDSGRTKRIYWQIRSECGEKMKDDVQIFGLSYQKNGVVIYFHEENYMRDQESQCGMSVNLQVRC